MQKKQLLEKAFLNILTRNKNQNKVRPRKCAMSKYSHKHRESENN